MECIGLSCLAFDRHRGEHPVQYAAEAEELALRAAKGDAAALDALLQLLGPETVRRCGRFLPCREDAEEAAQDVLLQVSRKITSFEGRSRFSTWLYVVVSNCARQKYRELKRRAAEQPTAIEPDRYVDPRTTSVIAGSRIDLLEALERLEREHPQLVAPLVYRDICQLDYAEIADRVGIPLGTLKSRLHQARQEVRPWLTDAS
jgi:RNA polymerase sigma-70 factor (ECF subfamily)